MLSCGAGAQAWWDASTVSHFWRTWNLPVHSWILRTAHAPALRAGAGQMGAVIACFAISAALHELAVAVPLRVITTPHAAIGMLAQARRRLLPGCSRAHAPRQRPLSEAHAAPFKPCAVSMMQAHDRRMRARVRIGLSGTCPQRMHGPHAARESDAHARTSRHVSVTLRAAPRCRSPWPGRATSCARAACCRPGPATRWCWALRPSARPRASCCMRRRRHRAPAAGGTSPAAYLRHACTAVPALLRHCAS